MLTIFPFILSTDNKHFVILANTIFHVDITMSYNQEYLNYNLNRTLIFDDFDIKIDQIKVKNTLIKWYDNSIDFLVDRNSKYHFINDEGITLKPENISNALLAAVDPVYFHFKPIKNATYDQRNLDESTCEFSAQEPIMFVPGIGLRFDLERCIFCVRINKDGKFIFRNLIIEDKNPLLFYVSKDIPPQQVVLETNFNQLNKILQECPLKIPPKQVDALQFTLPFRLLNDLQ